MSRFNSIAIERFLRNEFSQLSGLPDGRLLDLGCGTRPYCQLYERRYGLHIAGDYTIRTRIDVQLDAARLPFPADSFDVVLISEVIEHLPDADMALAEISRILKPGGLLLITWPFNYMMHEIPHDYARYTEFGMAMRLDKIGMKIEYLFRRGNALVLLWAIVEFLSNGLCESLSRLPVLGKVFRLLKDPFLFVVFDTPYKLYYLLTWRSTYAAQGSVGAGIKGWLGHLALWHLGYCARVRKLGDV